MPHPLPPRESSVVDAIRRHLTARGAWVLKVHGGPSQRRGVPDLLVCYGGRFIAIEVKRRGGRATPLQEHALREIEAAGGLTTLASDIDSVARLLDGISLQRM